MSGACRVPCPIRWATSLLRSGPLSPGRAEPGRRSPPIRGSWSRWGWLWRAAAASDVLLRELLYTPEGLLDRGALCRTVAAGESPLKVVWLDEEPRRRASELSGLLSAAMEREEASVDTATPVESTVRQLQAALRIQQLRARLARGAN